VTPIIVLSFTQLANVGRAWPSSAEPWLLSPGKQAELSGNNPDGEIRQPALRNG
jgi:hypothetical protein